MRVEVEFENYILLNRHNEEITYEDFGLNFELLLLVILNALFKILYLTYFKFMHTYFGHFELLLLVILNSATTIIRYLHTSVENFLKKNLSEFLFTLCQ